MNTTDQCRARFEAQDPYAAVCPIEDNIYKDISIQRDYLRFQAGYRAGIADAVVPSLEDLYKVERTGCGICNIGANYGITGDDPFDFLHDILEYFRALKAPPAEAIRNAIAAITGAETTGEG